jgi:hypothetical protein
MYAIKIHTGTIIIIYRASLTNDPGCPLRIIPTYDVER